VTDLAGDEFIATNFDRSGLVTSPSRINCTDSILVV
jgi:hypothetical protein